MEWLCLLAAQAPTTPPGGGRAESPLLTLLVPVAIIFVVMYLFIFAPQRKKEKERRAMIGALAKGDDVVTIGGIHGRVTQVAADDVVLDVGQGAKLTFSRAAIARVKKGGEGATA